MGCALKTSASINQAVDARRLRPEIDSSLEDSEALDEAPIKSKWLMNKTKAMDDKKLKAIAYRKQLKEQ